MPSLLRQNAARGPRRRRSRAAAGIATLLLAILALGTCYARFQCGRAQRSEHLEQALGELSQALDCKPSPCRDELARAREATLDALRSSAWPDAHSAFLLQNIDFLMGNELPEAGSPVERIVNALASQGPTQCRLVLDQELERCTDEICRSRLELYSRLLDELARVRAR